MANDSITNRLSNETISTIRKNRFEANDLSQVSFFDQLLDFGDPCRSADEHDLVDLALGNAGILEHLLHRL